MDRAWTGRESIKRGAESTLNRDEKRGGQFKSRCPNRGGESAFDLWIKVSLYAKERDLCRLSGVGKVGKKKAIGWGGESKFVSVWEEGDGGGKRGKNSGGGIGANSRFWLGKKEKPRLLLEKTGKEGRGKTREKKKKLPACTLSSVNEIGPKEEGLGKKGGHCYGIRGIRFDEKGSAERQYIRGRAEETMKKAGRSVEVLKA